MAKVKRFPETSSIEELRNIYQKLSAPKRTYYKTLIRVHLRRGSYLAWVIHTEPNNVNLTTKGYRNAVRVVPEYLTDAAGNQIPIRLSSTTEGSLYGPLSSLSMGMDYESALCFKIDCDLARTKTGNIEDALVHYIQESGVTELIAQKKKKLVYKSKPGPNKKSNSSDLLDRYGRDEETARWIKNNSEKLDEGNFSHENYKDRIFANSVSIEYINTL